MQDFALGITRKS